MAQSSSTRIPAEQSGNLWLATFEVHNGAAGYILKHAIRAKTEAEATKRALRFVREFYLEDGRPVEEPWRPRGAYERKDSSEYIEFEDIERMDAERLIEALLV